NPTPAVDSRVANACTASVSARMAVTPARDCVVNAKEPTWKSATAARSAAFNTSFSSPIMNTWPIRCASDMPARVRSAQDGSGVVAAVSLGVAAADGLAAAADGSADVAAAVGEAGAGDSVVLAAHPTSVTINPA